MTPQIGLYIVASHMAAGDIKTCEKCGKWMKRDLSSQGSTLGDGDHGRISTGWICGPAGCGHWQDEIRVHMPDIPPPDRRYIKVSTTQMQAPKSQLVLQYINEIKFWLFNGATLQGCCDKLAEKKVFLSATNLHKHLKNIMVKEAAQ